MKCFMEIAASMPRAGPGGVPVGVDRTLGADFSGDLGLILANRLLFDLAKPRIEGLPESSFILHRDIIDAASKNE